MTDIFLNYARADLDLANEIANAFEMEGLTTWQDIRGIQVGTDFVSVIRDALEKARCIVTLWTPFSVRKGWVAAEAKIGLEMGTLLPIAVGVAVEDIPSEFKTLQTLVTRSNKVDPDELDHLIKAVRSRLASTKLREAAKVATAIAPPTPTIRQEGICQLCKRG